VLELAANEQMKLRHDGTVRMNALPTTIPANNSISATEIPISRLIIDATRIVPARSAATAMSLTVLYLLEDELRVGRGHRRRGPRLGGGLTPL
jgi:hypothetical protein